MSELSKNAIIYTPSGHTAPLGCVQIIHGMAEHQGRYRELSQFLSENGWVCVTSDLRGHGNNINRTAELGFFGDNASSRITGDIHENTMFIREHFPDLPYIIIAHGIGALIAVQYIKKYDNFVDGLFISGMPSDRPFRKLLELFAQGFIMLKGEYHRSKLMAQLVTGPFSSVYSKEGSDHSWLSSDPESVKRYENDPKCGFIYTLNGYKVILEMMDNAFSKGSWIKKNLSCPVRLLWGYDDPCYINSQKLMRSVHLFSDAGYTNVAYITYPGQRHEVFQDQKKEIVFRDVLRELGSIKESKPDQKKQQPPSKTHIVLNDFIDPEVELPLEKEEKINLEEFISAHKPEGEKAPASDVELVDYIDYDDIP